VSELRETEAPPPSPSLLYLHPPRELDLKAPAVLLELTGEEGGLTLRLESDVLAKNVYLTLPGAHFSDNFFDLLPGRSRRVRIQTDASLEEARAGLRLRTLAEIPQEGMEVEPADSTEAF